MKKSRKKWILLSILGGLLVFFLVINIIPPAKVVEHNPFRIEKGELPMIAAHRGGSINNPENTMLAFREAVKTIGVDILESDLYLTKDGYLVYNHDSYVDRTCNINGDISAEEVKALCEDKSKRHYISDMTLEELQQYNFGYYFTDKSGNRPYKDVEDHAALGLQIATVDRLFEEFYESYPDLLFIVEIKNGGDLGVEACRILNETLEKYPNYADQIVIGTFHPEVEEELRENYPHLMHGAATSSAAAFYVTHLLGVNLFYNGDFSCLQIPMSYDVGIELPMDLPLLIRRAQRKNIAVQYWTISNAEDMRKLIEMGCDCIMTDDPALMKQVLEEYQ